MNTDMARSESINLNALKWSLLIGLGLSAVQFVSNWIGLIHQNQTPTSFQLFDISFYYFSPLVSWTILTIIAIKTADRWMMNKARIRAALLQLIVIVLLASPLVRMFDILVDFSAKNLLGMIHLNPLAVLNDVWLVVLFSTPMAAFKIVVIMGVVYYYKRQASEKKTLTVRTGDGAYHVIPCTSIVYLQADGNYLNVQTSTEIFRTRTTLKSLQSKLGSGFLRIHKSTIVNWRHIKQLKHWRNGEYLLMMTNDKPLTSSKSYKTSIDFIKDQIMVPNEAADDPRSATVHPTMA